MSNLLGQVLLVAAIMLIATIVTAHAAGSPPPVVRGLTGKVVDMHTAVPAQPKAQLLSECQLPHDIDLKRMSEWSLNFLIRTPRKQLNYEPVFQIFPYRCPPGPEGSDPVVGCDTDARMDWEWYYMRDITGSKKGLDVEWAFHKRMRDYVDENGVTWCHPGAFNEGNTSAKYDKKDYVIHMWGQTKIMKSQCEDYARTKNPQSKALARKMMLALKELVKWDDQGRCYSACGNGTLDAGHNPIPNAWNPHPLPIIEPLIRYYQVFGDKEALSFAKAYVEGMIAGIQPDGIKFGSDGSFNGHSHVTMHSVWGVAYLGVVTGDRKYTDWAKRVWDFFLTKGTGTGWFPAAPSHPGDEVCCVSDVMSTAACIAQGGHPEYFDYVERYMRNRISPSQFILSPTIEKHYAELNANLGSEKIKYGLSELSKYQGGFVAGCGLNDWENALLGYECYGNGPEICMIGCCQGEGMRAIYTTWSNTITKQPKSPLGPAGIYVNMSFNRDSKWGKVVSFMPNSGRLTVVATVQDRFFFRPPHWAPKKDVHAFVNGEPLPIRWSGAYVEFRAEPGQELTITYPLVAFTHQVDGLWDTVPNLKISFNWLGNMVTGATPRAERTPLFTGKPRVLPAVQ